MLEPQLKSIYHIATSDITVTQNVSTTAVPVTFGETAAGATLLSDYNTSSACTDSSGAAVTNVGSATAPAVNIPVSVTGAGANGRAQTITCTIKANGRRSCKIQGRKYRNDL